MLAAWSLTAVQVNIRFSIDLQSFYGRVRKAHTQSTTATAAAAATHGGVGHPFFTSQMHNASPGCLGP